MGQDRFAPIRRFIAGWLCAGATIGCVAGFLTVLQNDSFRAPLDAVVFTGWVTLGYLLAFLVFGVGVALFTAALRALKPRGRPLEAGASERGDFAAALLIALVAFIAFVLAQRAFIRPPFRIETHKSVQAVGILAAGTVTVFLMWLTGRAAVRSALTRLRGHVPLVLLSVVLMPLLASFQVARRQESDTTPPPGALPTTSRRVILIGLDGLEWERLRPLMDQGRLPHFEQLCRSGSSAPLTTLLPTWSPIIWTSVATGQRESMHGIHDFSEVLIPGLSGGIQRLRKKPRIPSCWGLASMVELANRQQLVREVPIRSVHRRTKALWNILSDQDVEVGVVNWFATWPCEAVHGHLVSDNNPSRRAFLLRKHGHTHSDGSTLTYPPSLMAELAEIPDDSDEDGAAADDVESLLQSRFFTDLPASQRAALQEDPGSLDVFRIIHDSDAFAVTAGLHLLREKEPQFLAVYLSGIDNVSHRIWDLEGVVDRYYEYVDEVLGRYLDEAGDDTTFVIVSDHGWHYDPDGRFAHGDAPDGVAILSGAGVRAGAALAPQPSVYDVAPTVLALLGLPTAADMPGRPMLDAFTVEARASIPEGALPTYGSHVPSLADHQESSEIRAGAEEDLEKLRALGYVK